MTEVGGGIAQLGARQHRGGGIVGTRIPA